MASANVFHRKAYANVRRQCRSCERDDRCLELATRALNFLSRVSVPLIICTE
jgi:hypothetical protein